MVRRSALAVWLVVASATSVFAAGEPARAQSSADAAVLVDRVIARWYAPETGGASKPRFIFERELAFEARLEALADGEPDAGALRERHVRAALDRIVAETILANLPVTPAPTAAEVATRAEAARAMLVDRLKGAKRLAEAAAREGIGSDEIDAMLRRQAKASLYLDRMVTPMLEPTESELREALRAGGTPFDGQPFERVREGLSRWVVGRKLARALDTYFQGIRARVVIVLARRPAAR